MFTNLANQDPVAYIIDYGQARKYLDSEGHHIPDQMQLNSGNEWFASVNAFRGHTHSRRDDIIQLIYTLIYCLDGFKHILKHAPDESKIGPFKLRAKAREMCSGPKTFNLTQVLEEAYSYKYDQRPNYDKLKFLIRESMLIKNRS